MRSLKGLALRGLDPARASSRVVDVVGRRRAHQPSRPDRRRAWTVRSRSTSQDLLDADDAVAGHRRPAPARVRCRSASCSSSGSGGTPRTPRSLGVRGASGPGWAIGGWFIPLANFVLPGVQLFQSSKASDVDAPLRGPVAEGRRRSIIAWAIAFGLGAIAARLAAAALVSTDDEGNVDHRVDGGHRGRGSRATGRPRFGYVRLRDRGAPRHRRWCARLTAAADRAYACAAQLSAAAPPRRRSATAAPPGARPAGPPPAHRRPHRRPARRRAAAATAAPDRASFAAPECSVAQAVELRPGHLAQLHRVHQRGVRGHDPHGDPVATGLLAGEAAAVAEVRRRRPRRRPRAPPPRGRCSSWP